MLTIIGFSVHDTIVVFDRIRENRARHAGEPFAEIVNHSILQTFGRSITTSLTVVLTLLALLLFGGAAINDFVLALLIGIVSGTYSSIFVRQPAARRLAALGGPPARPRRDDPRAPSPPLRVLTADRCEAPRQSRGAATRVILTDVLEPRFRWVLPGPRRGPGRASAAAGRGTGLGPRGRSSWRAAASPTATPIDAFFGEPLDGLHDAALLPDIDDPPRIAWRSRATRASASSSSATSTRTG